MQAGEMRVSYPVKDLLEKMDVKLDTFTEEMRTKASREELNALVARVDAVERTQWRISGAAAAGVVFLTIALHYAG